MLDIFEILGPIMVGPSSSHTAGAVRIGRMARTLLGERPVRADIGLYGSFAELWLLSGGTLVGATTDAVEERGLALGGKHRVEVDEMRGLGQLPTVRALYRAHLEAALRGDGHGL